MPVVRRLSISPLLAEVDRVGGRGGKGEQDIDEEGTDDTRTVAAAAVAFAAAMGAWDEVGRRGEETVVLCNVVSISMDDAASVIVDVEVDSISHPASQHAHMGWFDVEVLVVVDNW